MKSFGKEAEQQLLDCARMTQGYVSDGLDPDDALVKAAEACDLPYHMLPLAVSAYNTGAQAFQREKAADSGSSVLDAVQEFPIARIESVRSRLYPSKEANYGQLKQASRLGVSDAYSRPPQAVAGELLTKTAGGFGLPQRPPGPPVAKPVMPVLDPNAKPWQLPQFNQYAGPSPGFRGGMQALNTPSPVAPPQQLNASGIAGLPPSLAPKATPMPVPAPPSQNVSPGMGNVALGPNSVNHGAQTAPKAPAIGGMLGVGGAPAARIGALAKAGETTLFPAEKAVFAKRAARREVDTARGDLNSAKDAATAAIGRVRGYFKLANSVTPAVAASSAHHLFGKQADTLFAYLFPGLVKQATVLSQPVSANDRPYDLIKAALAAFDRWGERQRRFAQLERELPAKEAALLAPFSESEPRTILDPRPARDYVTDSLKKAGFLNPVLTGLSAGIGSTLKKDPAQRVAAIESQLDDPDHMEELKSIQARAVLHDMMNNDEVINGYDPTEVIDVYNELVQLSPSAATRPAMLRPLLRQRLTAGSLQPFDVQQMSQTESDVRKTQATPVVAGQTGLLTGDAGYVPGH